MPVCTAGWKNTVWAFSHNFFFTFEENSHIFGHYRAALYNGELSEREAPLAAIGAALKSCPELRDDIHAFISRHGIERKDLDCRGVEWEQLKNEFGLLSRGTVINVLRTKKIKEETGQLAIKKGDCVAASLLCVV